MANYLALQLSKPFGDDWFGSIGFVTGHATEVNPGTSSQAASNLNKNVVLNPNEDVASPSNYSFKRRVVSSLTYQHQFFSDYLSSVSAFYDGHTGSPYSAGCSATTSTASATTRRSDRAARATVRSVSAYIPRPGRHPVRQRHEARASIQQFYDYIKSNKYLSDHAGQMAGRNGVECRLGEPDQPELPSGNPGHLQGPR